MLTKLRDARFAGKSRSPNIVPFHMLGIVSYCAIVTLIFNFKTCRDLEIRVRGHSRSLKVELVFYRNIVPKIQRFWDIRLQKCRGLENLVRGPSRSLEMSPCDRAHMTSYWRSIVTMALSRVVSEIFNVEKCRDNEIGVRGQSRSSKEVPFYTPGMVSY